jgi:hypothetical protein
MACRAQELKLQDGNIEYLSPKLSALVAKADGLAARAKEQPHALQQLVGLMQAMYMDYCRVCGISTPTQRLPALEAVLKDTTTTREQVLAFMQARL